MSGATFAQTSVVIGGKFDAGYQFNHAKRTDSANGAPQTGPNAGGSTTEAQTDGSASSSRITVVAKEALGSGYSAEVNLDLRFTNIHEGKAATSSSQGGLSSNDKKVL